MLNKFHLDKANVATTSMKESAVLLPCTDREATTAEKKRYQSITGSIIFSMVETRPDIAFATSVAAKFTKNLSHQHTKAIKTILEYLKGLREQRITFGGQDKLFVERYSDFD